MLCQVAAASSCGGAVCLACTPCLFGSDAFQVALCVCTIVYHGRPLLFGLAESLGIGARSHNDRLSIHEQATMDQGVQQLSVVGYQHANAAMICENTRNDLAHLGIEVVSGLVYRQDVGVAG